MYNPADAQKSCTAFKKFVEPVLRHDLKAKVIVSTERQDSELAKILDCSAGIDGVFIDMDGWTHFYASRIQFGVNYAAFSIRYYRPMTKKTEFDYE